MTLDLHRYGRRALRSRAEQPDPTTMRRVLCGGITDRQTDNYEEDVAWGYYRPTSIRKVLRGDSSVHNYEKGVERGYCRPITMRKVLRGGITDRQVSGRGGISPTYNSEEYAEERRHLPITMRKVLKNNTTNPQIGERFLDKIS
ncbi:hypothetical protein J6590_020984 [Homalodisca vitripennis]|nr:hypothetical protein J6590_020984 [Homalodisca vitripennis]